MLSYPQYCRYRSMLARLREQPSSLLVDHAVLALGGIAAVGANTRILYCRDTFDHPALLHNKSICDQFGEFTAALLFCFVFSLCLFSGRWGTGLLGFLQFKPFTHISHSLCYIIFQMQQVWICVLLCQFQLQRIILGTFKVAPGPVDKIKSKKQHKCIRFSSMKSLK